MIVHISSYLGELKLLPQLADLIDTIERLRTQVEAIAQQK